MVKLPLTKNKTQWLYIIIALSIIFTLNLIYQYIKYSKFSQNTIYVTNSKVLNIYPKKDYQVLKLKSDDFTYFTSNKTKEKFLIHDDINLYINTTNITFIDYLKGFYTTSFNLHKLPNTPTILSKLSQNITSQHKNDDISSLFNALFFAIPINKTIRDACTDFGVSHLVAISGFHLGILSLIIFWILYFPYNKIHQINFPYRNKKFDILLIISVLLFIYLIFVDFVPSLLRAFTMFIFGIIILRANIKLLSFSTLALVVMLIIAFFPKLLFSISLWFSVAGVFYIFLFIQYFKNLNKILAFFLFNFWIYLAINPITHFFFGTIALEQLYSPLFTIGFTIFYPLELFLHLINQGALLDKFVLIWIEWEIKTLEVFTPLWIFIGYILISFLSIPCPKWFRTLNLSIIAFNLWIFLKLF